MSDETTSDVGDVLDDFGAEDEGTEEVGDEVEAAPEGDEPAAHEEPVPDPAKAPEKKAEPKPARTYRIKVNGKDQEVPAEDVDKAARAIGVEPEALLGGTRMFKAANERFQQAAAVEKQARATLEALKTRPRDALREMLGEENFAKLAIEAVQDLMASENMTPEQRRIRELEQAQAKHDEEKQAQVKEREAQQAERYQSDVAQRLDKEITEALVSGKLPKDPYVIKRFVAAARDYLDNGGSPDGLSSQDFIPLVQDTLKKEHEAFLGGMSGEDVIQRFPALAEKVRKAYADRVSGRRRVPEQPTELRARPKAETKRYGSIGAALRDW